MTLMQGFDIRKVLQGFRQGARWVCRVRKQMGMGDLERSKQQTLNLKQPEKQSGSAAQQRCAPWYWQQPCRVRCHYQSLKNSLAHISNCCCRGADALDSSYTRSMEQSMKVISRYADTDCSASKGHFLYMHLSRVASDLALDTSAGSSAGGGRGCSSAGAGQAQQAEAGEEQVCKSG